MTNSLKYSVKNLNMEFGKNVISISTHVKQLNCFKRWFNSLVCYQLLECLRFKFTLHFYKEVRRNSISSEILLTYHPYYIELSSSLTSLILTCNPETSWILDLLSFTTQFHLLGCGKFCDPLRLSLLIDLAYFMHQHTS